MILQQWCEVWEGGGGSSACFGRSAGSTFIFILQPSIRVNSHHLSDLTIAGIASDFTFLFACVLLAIVDLHCLPSCSICHKFVMLTARSLRPIKRLGSPSAASAARRSLTSSTKLLDPLRVLFCGSDDFSKYSLRALYELKQESPETIGSLEVVCRPDKRTGRGLKQIHEGTTRWTH